MHAGSTTVVVERPRSPVSDEGPDLSHEQQLQRVERKSGHPRRYAPKTRTGCLTWIRRVKCDEEKPSCRRCTATGRKCDGYATPNQLVVSGSSEPLAVALVNDVTVDPLERRTFDFFRARTVPCVSGYFHDVVWERIVLQLSHSEPAVRHAVNALGALHEESQLQVAASHHQTESHLVKRGFPLTQYSKALAAMQSLLKNGKVSLDVVLLCSLICVHFEALRESFVPALMHVENAIKLLSSNATFDARKVNPDLVRALMRMDLQGSMYLDSRIPGLPYYTAATDSTLPNAFYDINHARDMVSTWTCRLIHFLRLVADEHKARQPGDVALEHFAKAQELEQTAITMDRMLWDFMHKPTARLNLKEQHGLGLLRARVKINRILAATCLYSEACVYDQYLQDFKDILAICLYILASDNVDSRFFSVSLDEGIIQPLYFIALHCRDGRTRHQAMEQLDQLPTRDGLWHVATTSHTAKMCILFEEAVTGKEMPTCEDIPEWRRIHRAGYSGWDGGNPRKTVKAHLRTRPNGMDGEWHDFEGDVDWAARSLQFNESWQYLMSKKSDGLTPALETFDADINCPSNLHY